MNELERSFTDYVQEHRGPMFRVARFMCRDTQTAEDVVQDVFLKFWIKWPLEGERIKAHGVGYAITASRRAAIDEWRKGRNAPSLLAELDTETAPDAPDEYAGVDLLQIVAELDDTSFRLIILIKIEKWTIAEAANRLGLPETTARRYLTRALRILNKKLGPPT